MDEFETRKRDQRHEAMSNYALRQHTSGIPERYRAKRFYPTPKVSAPHREALRKCEGYARRFPYHAEHGECLIMAGKVGTGKTYAACLVANYVLANLLQVRYFTELGLAQWVREKHWESRSRVEQASAVDLLVIDEVGLSKLDDRERGVITEVISERYNRQAPMIIVSNAPFTSCEKFNLETVLGDRVIDRLKEMGGPRLVFNWKSLRDINH